MNNLQTLILSLFCETLVYGIFCVAITVVIYFLCTEKDLALSRKALFGVAILQFMLASAHEAMVVHGTYVVQESIRFSQASAFIGQISEFIGACILIWRVWHVWGKRWAIIVIPFPTSLAGLIAGMIFPAALTSRSQLTRLLPIPSGAVALAGVIVNTLLIVGRLIYQQWQMKKVMGPAYESPSSSYLRAISLVMIESGAVLAAIYTAALVLEKRGSPVTHIMLNMLEPVFGLNPTLIIVLVHLNHALGTHSTKKYTETLSAVRFGSGPRQQWNTTIDSMTLESTTSANTTKVNKLTGRRATGDSSPGHSDSTLYMGEKAIVQVEHHEVAHLANVGQMV